MTIRKERQCFYWIKRVNIEGNASVEIRRYERTGRGQYEKCEAGVYNSGIVWDLLWTIRDQVLPKKSERLSADEVVELLDMYSHIAQRRGLKAAFNTLQKTIHKFIESEM